MKFIKHIFLIFLLVLSIQQADAKKHRILMDMAEIGVARYMFKHEAGKVAERITMKNGEKISLDVLKARIKAHRANLNALSDAEKHEKDGGNLWKNLLLGVRGLWSGIKGESRYTLPQDSKYMSKTNGLGINHTNGHPFLYDKDTARLTMDKPSGNSKIDIKEAYERMGKIINKSRKYVNDIFSKEKRTLHHTANGDSLISVDSYLHAKTPHGGGSYYNRNKGIVP